MGLSRGRRAVGREDIKARASAFRQQQGFSAEAGARKENIKKNRYKDILPYDQTRVVVTLCTDEGQTDYINASFIQWANNKRCYIATQGPLPHTVLDFWRMIWEYGVKVIAMACREVEMGKKKCERYWPLKQEPLQIGPFSIVQIKEQELNPDVTVRTLSVSFQKEERPLTHFQYVAWPDRGIPDNYSHFLELIEHVRLTQGDDSAPICVHCSAGCGRTGVICILEHVRHLLLQQSIPPNFSIFDIVLAMRKQRPSAVQTLEQYEFLYHAVAEMFRNTLATTYENLKENQLPLYDDAVSLRRPAPHSKHSSVLRSISVPSEPTPDLPPKMSDTYAVVNKFRRGGRPAGSPSRETSPAWSPIDPSGFGGLQASYSLPGSPVKRLPPSPSCEYTPNSASAGDASPRGPSSPSARCGTTLLHSLKPPVSPPPRASDPLPGRLQPEGAPPWVGLEEAGGASREGSESGRQGSLPSSGRGVGPSGWRDGGVSQSVVHFSPSHPQASVASPQKTGPSSPRHDSDGYEAVDPSPGSGCGPLASPGNGLGYNFRIGKPKGPRDPPAEWTRL
ncbi:tyrosine-protein phosphatase non-receptor type 18 isoform X2 [Chelonia mydas]|uniref:tyrosine-protein phosphatase non-receptor type 18 isoform X2 n=1 Tax=Chelonia mydas TaxID=8469 RepID=UPI001CA96F82|nr:tyrosine-protein phosphatase non-receptor type 18 isoform X2 [Chelonia mydas]